MVLWNRTVRRGRWFAGAQLCFAVFDAINSQVELMVMSFQFSAILRSLVSEYTNDAPTQTDHERQHFVVQQGQQR